MIQSVERALQLLTLIAADGGALGVRELSRRSGLTVPTTQNLLKTLAAQGFLSFDPERRDYRVGLAVLTVAESADPVTCVHAFGHPYVMRLHRNHGFTVALLTVWQKAVLVADWADTRHGLAVIPRRRVVEKPFGLASGRVLLAWHPGSAGATPEMARRLAEVRRTGLAVTEDYDGSGVYAVAAPVVDACGRVSVSLGCSTPTSCVDEAGRDRLREAVVSTARHMSDALTRLPGSEQ